MARYRNIFFVTTLAFLTGAVIGFFAVEKNWLRGKPATLMDDTGGRSAEWREKHSALLRVRAPAPYPAKVQAHIRDIVEYGAIGRASQLQRFGWVMDTRRDPKNPPEVQAWRKQFPDDTAALLQLHRHLRVHVNDQAGEIEVWVEDEGVSGAPLTNWLVDRYVAVTVFDRSDGRDWEAAQREAKQRLILLEQKLNADENLLAQMKQIDTSAHPEVRGEIEERERDRAEIASELESARSESKLFEHPPAASPLVELLRKASPDMNDPSVH